MEKEEKMKRRSTMTTFRSDDEYWAWADRQARRMERMQKAARFAALLAVGAALVFALLMVVVRCAGAGRYDPWEQTISDMRARGAGG